MYNGSNFFSVNSSTGEVSLTSLLPIASLPVTLEYVVFARDGGGLTTNITIFFNIVGSSPPNCSISSSPIAIQFNETVVSGTCWPTVITCIDSLGRGLNLTVSLNDDSTRGQIALINAHDKQGGLRMEVCVAGPPTGQSLLTVGKFQMLASVNSSAGTTSLLFNITVLDVNQPPFFEHQNYSVTVPENVANNTVVAYIRTPSQPALPYVDIVINDPDTLNSAFGLGNVTNSQRMEFANGTVINQGPLELRGAGINRTVVVQRMTVALRPDVIYTLFITAVDNQGLTAISTLTMKVLDINQPPYCMPNNYNTDLDLLTKVGSLIFTMACADDDYNATYRSLSYAVYNETDFGYFKVWSDGNVTLATAVPRTALLLTLKAYVVDGMGLRSNVTISFNITGDYRPVCSTRYIPPSTAWLFNTCFKVYPNCSDPSNPGDSHYLNYSFTGNWTLGFRQTVMIDNTSPYAEFCYTQTENGTYEIILNITNGLGITTWQQPVQVVYQRVIPAFNTSKYDVRLSEMTSVGDSILVLVALVDNRTTPLIYSLSDNGNGNASHFFSINSSTGAIYVAQPLRQLANHTVNLLITAKDPSSSLAGTIYITIFVIDINEPPTCNNVTVTASWGINVGEGVTTVNCTDPDVSPANTNLVYNAKDLVWTVINGSVVLANRSKLEQNPTISAYNVTIYVNNDNFTVTAIVIINLNRTLPIPYGVQINNITNNGATVLWTFDIKYRPVITNITLTISRKDINYNRTYLVPMDSTSFYLEGLTAGVVYSTYVTVVGLPGITSMSSTAETFTTEVYKHTSLQIQILNISWKYTFLNNLSSEYIALTSQLISEFDTTLKGRLIGGYVSSRLRSYRKGSVLADIVITTNQLTSNSDLQSNLTVFLIKGSIGNLTVNSTFDLTSQEYATLTYSSPGKILLPDNRTEAVVERSNVTATCMARFVGDITPTFAWSRDNRNLIISTRYTITNSTLVEPKEDSHLFYSNLIIRQITISDKGNFTCTVAESFNSTALPIDVRVALIATLTPYPSPVVTSGVNANLNCERIAGYESHWTASLHRYTASGLIDPEGSEKTQVAGQQQVSFDNITVKETTTFFCRIKDNYASMDSINATVIFNTPYKPLCLRMDMWPNTTVGNIVELPCPPGYAPGKKQSRNCSPNGEWLPINTDACVRQDIVNLQEKVNLIDEKNPSETTAQVGEWLTSITSNFSTFLVGDLLTSVNIMQTLASITSRDNTTSNNTLNYYVKSADNLLHADDWENQTSAAFGLIEAVDKMAKGVSKGLNSEEVPPIRTNKIVVVVGMSDASLDHITFPNQSSLYAVLYPDWVRNSINSVSLDKNGRGQVSYSAAIYNNLSNIFNVVQRDNLTKGDQNEMINSPIIALSADLGNLTTKIKVKLTFEHITSNFSTTSCKFLNFSDKLGKWSGNGCQLIMRNSQRTECECDHLTNFAVLMSPYRPTGKLVDVLNYFTIVGCAVSIFFLVVTLIIYFMFWEYLTQDRNNVSNTRSKILVNLCVMLIIAYITFLAGVNRVDDKAGCTAVAAILHYVWLVVFFLMLCEGIDIFISIILVFPRKSIFLWLLLMSYGVPAIIVAISLGVTKLEGYGGSQSCWLSVENGVLWAFVAPALATLLANFIVIVLVMRTLLRSTTLMTKSKRQQAKSIVWAICVMSPVLGLTWVFGVLGVNEETVAFQVLFVIFNSLQGLMIFIFHCLLAKQVRDCFKNKWNKYQSSKLETSTTGGKHSSSSKYNEKLTSESGVSDNDLSRSKSPVSPFLQADIQADLQMEQMASKVRTGEGPNLLTPNEPLKGVELKNPLAAQDAVSNRSGHVGDSFMNMMHDNSNKSDNGENPPEKLNLTSFKEFLKLSSDKSGGTTSAFGDSKGIKQEGNSHKGRGSVGSNESDGNPYRRGNDREKMLGKSMGSVSEDIEQKRLDLVYGEGSRLPGDVILSSKSAPPVAPKGKGGNRLSSSTLAVKTFTDNEPGVPPFEDHPAHRLTLKKQWEPAYKQQLLQESKKQPWQSQPYHHQPRPKPSPYRPVVPSLKHPPQQQRPSSPPRRMAMSAESLGAPHHPYAFAGSLQDGRRSRPGDSQMANIKVGGKGPAPQVPPKSSRTRNDPPLDYW